jgi:hypothetical protein
VFKDVTAASGVSYTGPSWSIAWGDPNGDAWPDLFLGNHGDTTHNLFINQRNGGFADSQWRLPDRDLVSDAHGAAWADFDNDGDQDLLELVGADGAVATKANHLYVNARGVLHDEAGQRGIVDQYGRGRHPVWLDWDNDGWLDVVVLNAVRPEGPSLLFRNARGYFEPTEALGPLGFTKYPLLGSFRPGKLHLVLSGQPFPYRVFDAHQVNPLPLTDLRAGLRIPQQAQQVMDAALFDINGDGIDDVFEVTGRMPSDARIVQNEVQSRLQIPDGGAVRGFDFAANGTIEVMLVPRGQQWWHPGVVYIGRNAVHPRSIPFVLDPNDPAVQGLATPRGDRGIYVGYDRASGRWQLRLAASLYQEANVVIGATSVSALSTVGFSRFKPTSRPALLLSADGRHVDTTATSGLATTPLTNCFSVAAADFDNDMDVDLAAACSGPLGRQGVANQVYRNLGAGRFAAVSNAAGLVRLEDGVADGVGAADLDLDGFVDLVITNGQGLRPFSIGRTQVFRNDSRRAGNGNHWLELDLRGVRSNRDGVGARVTVTAGGRAQWRLQRNGMHNGAQDFQRLHFGLGGNARAQTVEIVWPSGVRQVLQDVRADQVLRVTEGQGSVTVFATPD